jgi:hypothetical protein
MKSLYLTGAALILSLQAPHVYAYGSSSSSSGCDKPSFSDFEPAPNKYLQSFREFSFVTSSNTAPTSIEVNISFGELKQHFTAKQLEITPQKSGRLSVKGKADKPLEHGFIRISVKAHSKPGCEKTDGYLLRVQ